MSVQVEANKFKKKIDFVDQLAPPKDLLKTDPERYYSEYAIYKEIIALMCRNQVETLLESREESTVNSYLSRNYKNQFYNRTPPHFWLQLEKMKKDYPQYKKILELIEGEGDAYVNFKKNLKPYLSSGEFPHDLYLELEASDMKHPVRQYLILPPDKRLKLNTEAKKSRDENIAHPVNIKMLKLLKFMRHIIDNPTRYGWKDLLPVAALASGRRPSEIVARGSFSKGSHQMKFKFSDPVKKRGESIEPRELWTIGARASELCELINLIRQDEFLAGISHLTNDEINHKIAKPMERRLSEDDWQSFAQGDKKLNFYKLRSIWAMATFDRYKDRMPRKMTLPDYVKQNLIQESYEVGLNYQSTTIDWAGVPEDDIVHQNKDDREFQEDNSEIILNNKTEDLLSQLTACDDLDLFAKDEMQARIHKIVKARVSKGEDFDLETIRKISFATKRHLKKYQQITEFSLED